MTDDASDKDVLDATGRHPDEWFAFLDAKGAPALGQDTIVTWLADDFGLDEHWSSLIAGRYARARGTA